MDPGKNWSSYVTLIDLSTELLGLSTIWLGAEWYSLELSCDHSLSACEEACRHASRGNNTNHFTSSRGYIPEVPI